MAATLKVRVITVAVLFVAVLASCIPMQARTRIAPADEYFGRAHMSILEIGNRIHDTTYRAAHGVPASQLLSQNELIEDAVRDWESKYPADPWLPLDAAQVVHLYGLMQTQNGRMHMHMAYAWLVAHFAGRPYTILAGREVASIDAREDR
jgi:hypothetical protein